MYTLRCSFPQCVRKALCVCVCVCAHKCVCILKGPNMYSYGSLPAHFIANFSM